MKKLTRKQKFLIVLFSVSTLLLVVLSVYLTYNLISSTIPTLIEYGKRYNELGAQLIIALVVNIFVQIVLIFFYAISVWLGVESFKREKLNNQATK